MATCQTSRWTSTAPYVKLTVTESSSTGDKSTLSYTLQYISDYAANTNGAGREYTIKIGGTVVKEGTYNIDGVTGTKTIATGTTTINKTTSAQSIAIAVSFRFSITWSGSYKNWMSASSNISVAAKTSYSIKYNANGGSGAPSAQTKWYGTNVTLSSTKPTRSGYTFQGWATSASGAVSYASGATYSTNAAATLYAVWKAVTYTVTFNANGGSGVPSSQTKTHGVTLTLSSTKPTRTNYTFKGWGTSASATTVTYAAGANYTNNASVTLYAIWVLAYTKPRITNLSIDRCTSSGTLDESGTCALIKFTWATDKTVSSINIQWKQETASNWTNSTTVTSSGTSGTVSKIIGDGALDIELAYSTQVTVSDASGSTSKTIPLSGQVITIDYLVGGRGVAFGKPAELNNYLDSKFYALFRKEVESRHNDTAFVHVHETSGVRVGLGVGSGGSNRGIFDSQLKRWIFKGNGVDSFIGCTHGEVKPYYGPGDTLKVALFTAGYCTSTATYVNFSVPLAKPMLGVASATVASLNGLQLRSNGQYSHGSSATMSVSPTKYTCSINGNNTLTIIAHFTDVTNAQNNAAIGINAHIQITFN